MPKLNIGCGNKKIDGYINIDNNPHCRPDQVVDLDHGLGCFADDSMEGIRAEHILEHVEDLMFVLQEMFRISKDGAIWEIWVPHCSYGFLHPLHRRGFSVGTFKFFDQTTPECYGELDLRVQSVRLNYTRSSGLFLRTLALPFNALANLHARLCERLWCYWVGGFEEIQFTLRVSKPPKR